MSSGTSFAVLVITLREGPPWPSPCCPTPCGNGSTPAAAAPQAASRPPPARPIDDRKALTGILFVLKTGIDWEDLPQEMGCGCGMTCWRRLRDWTAAGVWQRLHELLLAELEDADKIDWSRATIDSRFVRARGGGEATGPSPVDRRKKGSKHHVITDARRHPAGGDRRRRPTSPT